MSTMEKLDRRILSLLARDGRMSYTDIGKETGLSTSAAQQRVRRLEQRGLIKGYHARLDGAQLGLLVTAFVAIKPFDPSQPDDAPDRLSTSRRSSPATRWPATRAICSRSRCRA